MLFRTVVKLYIERQSNRPGSHIKSKLIGGALALSVLPIFFLVLWSVSVLNRNLDKWFSRPAQTMNIDLVQIANALNQEVSDKLTAQAHWLASQPAQSADFYERFCQENQIEKAEIEHADGSRAGCCARFRHRSQGDLYQASIPTDEGKLVLSARMPLDLAAKQREINQAVADYNRLSVDKKAFRRLYLLLLSLITLFILFFAIWIARYMAGQISTPITALLRAAEQIRKGNLSYRVRVDAIDEMATLVRAFNEMTEALETNSKELEARRRFTEAILESIPTGVISLTSDGRIQRVNRALLGIFPEEQVARASRLSDLFSREDTAEIRYLMNRARRTAVAGTQIEYKAERRVLQLSLTVAALDEQRSSGFVLVVEDTSELLRAQKAAAWHEVARRVAHEIKNPLTPIALCADRIARQLARPEQTADTRRILQECSATIAREVESVRTLVDEFSQFTRFPAAQPVPSDLNQVVDNALVGLRRAAGWNPRGQGSGAGAAAGACGSRAVQARGGEPGGQRRRGDAGVAGEASLHRHALHRSRFGGADRRRHRLRRLARGQRKAVPAVFLDQGAGNGPGPGDRESHSGRSRSHHPGGRQRAHRRAFHRGSAHPYGAERG